MNANELANELDDACIEFVGDVWVPTFQQAATMLRQLQAENEALKANFNKENPVKEVFNKPVAYWDGKHFASKDKSSLADIPLYTHPVKELTLTDEEIEEIAYQWGCYKDEEVLEVFVGFAKAILRKASEK